MLGFNTALVKEYFKSSPKEAIAITALIAYNALASVSFLETYFTTLIGG